MEYLSTILADRMCKHEIIREDDKKFIADFYKYAFVGLMLEWIKDDMKTPPERIISRLADLIDGDVVRMLNKCRLDPPGSTS